MNASKWASYPESVSHDGVAATKANMTPFLMGIRKGIERAGGSLGE
jgi:hypothetical protein